MLGILSTIFGSGKVIEKGMDLIDEAWTSDEEVAENRVKTIAAKTQAKVDLLNAYAPYKIAQRYIAMMIISVFLFIMMNGVLGALYGIVPMTNVEQALAFANKMWLGEIVLAIISFYFGGGLVSEFNNKDKSLDTKSKS